LPLCSVFSQISSTHKLNTTLTPHGLLIVDDDPLIREGLAVALGGIYTTHQAETRSEAISLLRTLPEPPEFALVDLGLPPFPHRPEEGFHLITELLSHSPQIKIFVLSGQSDKSNARHARSLGAIDFIAKPCPPEKIKTLLDDALKVNEVIVTDDATSDSTFGIIGESTTIQALRNQIVMYAPTPFPILIEGESGCGKELVANAIQKQSGNPNSPFKALNCAAIAPTLIEPTLFGYSKGAFTGAATAQAGFFEEASDGTLFLDEIGELPLDLQTKLLRVLENGEYQRVGETMTRKSSARIIAATNRNLRGMIASGAFRNDLYHRLNVFSVAVPSLRELGDDKFVLLEHFRSHYTSLIKQPPFELDAAASTKWEHYSFPGNVRELRNIVIRLTTKFPGKAVNALELQEEFDPLEQSATVSKISSESIKQQLQQGDFSLSKYLHDQEGDYIAAALEITSGNISDAAKLLGLNRTTLHSRIGSHEKNNK